MVAKTAIGNLIRQVGYIRDVRFENNELYVRRTGVRIKLDRSFFRSFVSATEIYAYLVTLRLGRMARSIVSKPNENRRKIAFFPQLAAPWYNIWSVVQLSGYQITNDLDEADYVFFFEDSTYTNAASRLPDDVDARMINQRCSNIGKQYVADLFREVFGYDLSVDPTQYAGKIVRKSQHNGVHDGVVIEGPIDAVDVLPGYVYQKLVNTCADGARTEDLRIAYAFGEIPAVFHKYKAKEKQFGTEYLSVELKDAEDVFSEEERRLIALYCDEMGLDFGTVDVMRDLDDGRIYLVDVNKTCMPVLSLPFGKQIEAYRRITDAFCEGLDGKRS